uniref:Uncharacterized protein n=1 Tax=Acrobeloides nanus TaxID=290746 RepID=A0A914DR66_9BILA
MEYGFLVSITFIAVDRFFSFYFQYYGEKFIQKIYTLVILWILAFMTQFVLFIFGCPKMFNPITIVYNLPYPMFVFYLLIIIKIVALRYNVYHATRTFSKNDQVLAIQFLILCGIQYALSYLENYCKEGPDNYYGLIIMSVPFLIQISHALALLLTNLLIRKALMQFIFHRRSNSKVFAMAIGNPPSKQNLANSFKPRVLVKVTQRRWNIWKAEDK